MEGHHAIWANAEKPTSLYAGRLHVSKQGLRLDGAGPGGHWIAELPSEQIVRVRRKGPKQSMGDRHWLRLDLRNGGALLVGSILGSSPSSELIDAVTALL